MNAFTQLLRQITRIFQWWVIVTPWEQGLRVRLGRHVRRLGPGIHLAIPFVDYVYRQSVRQRLSSLQTQTLTTLDGRALTLSGAIAYSIDDIERLYETLHHAEASLQNLAEAAIAEHVSRSSSQDLSPESIERAVTVSLHFGQFGLGGAHLRITDFAFVRTYRLINDAWRGSWTDRLETARAVGEPAE